MKFYRSQMIAGWIIALGLLGPAEDGMVPEPAESPDEPTSDAPSAEAPEDADDVAAPAEAPAAEPDYVEPSDTPEEPVADVPAAEPPESAGLTDAQAEAILESRMEGLEAESSEGAESEEPAPSGPVRRGVVLSLGTGYAGCSKEWCAGYRGGIGGMAEVGVRLNRIMPVFGWYGGVGPYDQDTLSQEVGVEVGGSRAVRTNVLGAGVWLFPLGQDTRRIDPHFGVRLGYGWVKMNYAFEGISVAERIRRGVATLGGGIDGFVTNNLALGVRADMHIMFGGKYCRTFSASGESVSACADSDDVESRADPRDWPLPFSFLFQMRYTWDVLEPSR